MTITIDIFHTNDLGAYLDAPDKRDDRHAKVHTVEDVTARLGTAEDILAVLDNLYHRYNVGHDPEFGTVHPDAVAYRAKGLRSLSCGDRIRISSLHGNRVVEWVYEVASVGFDIRWHRTWCV